MPLIPVVVFRWQERAIRLLDLQKDISGVAFFVFQDHRILSLAIRLLDLQKDISGVAFLVFQDHRILSLVMKFPLNKNKSQTIDTLVHCAVGRLVRHAVEIFSCKTSHYTPVNENAPVTAESIIESFEIFFLYFPFIGNNGNPSVERELNLLPFLIAFRCWVSRLLSLTLGCKFCRFLCTEIKT